MEAGTESVIPTAAPTALTEPLPPRLMQGEWIGMPPLPMCRVGGV